MSKPSHTSSKEIHDKSELVEWFRRNCLPAEDLLIGVEHEKPPFYLDTHDAVPYEGENGKPGIKDCLQKMAMEHAWIPGYEMLNIIDLHKGSVNWTLEPGGQLETGGAPLKNIHQTARETDDNIKEAVETAKELDIGLLALGYHPTYSGDEMPSMPNSRFSTIRHYVEQKHFASGVDGLWCTSTVQVNLGYESEEDMVKKLRVALCLQPIVSALFANSPFKEGELSGFQSYRSHIIHNYMGGRQGFMLPVAFEEGFGFERFVDYAMNEMPLMGIYINDVFVDANGATFSDFMEGKLEACPGRKATIADWENHLNTIWPEVRLRRFLEMRGADNGPAEMIKALPAFWVGLLYDRESLDAAYEMVRDWTNEDREYLRSTTPETGLQTPFMGGVTSVQEIAQRCLDLAEAGLKRRAVVDEMNCDESIYLAPLREIASSGKNWAQRLVDRFNTVWNGNIDKLFDEQNYENEPSVLKPEISASVQRTSPPAKKLGA